MNITKVVLEADSTSVRTAKKDLDSLQQSGEKTEKTVGNLGKTIMGLAAAVGIGLSVREIVSYTDRWTDLNARLRNVTGSSDLANIALDRISQTARRTYSGMEQTANAFTRNAVTLTELGFTTERQLDLMESLNNALVISGTKGQQAESVMESLSRAFAFGELRGQNFNTVIQNGGRIVQALADGLGVGTLELRRMAEEGELKTSVVIDAITSQMRILTKEAEEMPATIGDGFLLLNNAMFEYVGRMDEALGASSAVSGVLVKLADNFDEVAAVTGIVAAALTTQYVTALGASVASMTSAAAAAGTLRAALLLLAGPGGAVAVAAGAMYLLIQRQKELAEENIKLANSFDPVLAKLGQMTERELAREAAALNETINAMQKKRDELAKLRDPYGNAQKQMDAVNRELAIHQERFDLLIRQLRRVQDGWVPVTDAVNQNTAAVISNTAAVESNISNAEYLNNVYRTQTGVIGITSDQYLRLMGSQKEHVAVTQQVGSAITAVGETNVVVTRDMQRQWDRTHEYMTNTLLDFMRNGGNAWDNIAKGFSAMVQRMVAEWAASGLMRIFGMGSPSGVASGGVAGTALSAIGGTVLKAGSQFLGGATGGAIGANTMMPTMASTLGAGAAALLTNPITWAVLGTAAIANALDKSTPSFNAGLLLSDVPGAKADQKFAVEPFASGVAPVGFARRADQGLAVEMIDHFRAVDSALVDIAAAAGFDLRASGSSLQGLNEQGLGTGRFLGLAGEDGKPGTSMEDQLTAYARGLVGQAYGAGQISGSVYEQLANAGNHIDIINAAASMVHGSHATGLDFVPFDGYRAELHRGERVQSASEARREDSMAQMMDSAIIQMAGLMRRIESIVDDWDVRGMPPVRA